MKLLKINKFENGKREVYFLNRKIYSYVNQKKYNVNFGLLNYADLPVSNLEMADNLESEQITIVYPVYYEHNDKAPFYKRIKEYENFSENIKQRLKIIIVDDCSKYPIEIPNVNLNIILLRIEKNIKWNNSGARNLGACFADTEKIILADIDWLIPEDSLSACINAKIQDDTFVVFESYFPDGTTKGTVHPNIYCTKKQTFLKYGGYNEMFCGFYGEDIFFRKKLLKNNVNFIRPKLKIIGLAEGLKEHSLSRNTDKAKKLLAHNIDINNCGNILKYNWHFVSKTEYKK